MSIIVSVIYFLQCKVPKASLRQKLWDFKNSTIQQFKQQMVDNEDLEILSHWKLQDETRALSNFGFNTHIAI